MTEELKQIIEKENTIVKEQAEFKQKCIECDQEILNRYSKEELCKILTSYIHPTNWTFDRHSQP